MRLIIFIVFVCAMFVSFQAQAAVTISDQKIDKLSYSMGYKIGTAFKKMNFYMVRDSFILGIKAGFHGLKPLVSLDEMKKILQDFQEQSTKYQAQHVNTFSAQ